MTNLRSFKSGLVLPKGYINNSMYPWLIMFFEGKDGHPPEFFVSHGRNFKKWDTEQKRREGYQILGHTASKEDASYVVKQYNKKLKGRKNRTGYQTTHSKIPINIRKMKKDI